LKTLHSRAFNYHRVHIDQPGLIQPTSIGSRSTRKQLHRRSVPREAWYAETRYWRSAKPMGVANLHHEV